jgi:hypothetical protein
VTRYGHATTITIRERRCLWYGAFRSNPVRIIVIEEPRRRPVNLLAALPRAADGRLMLAVDVSNWLRPGAATSPGRLFCHVHGRVGPAGSCLDALTGPSRGLARSR